MASYSSSIVFLTLLLSIYSSNAGLSIDLIHRDHPTKSPYFDSSLSPSDRLQSAFQRSISKSYNRFSSSPNSFTSQIIPNSFEYLMTLQVGTPPTKILAIADTGSDLTWTQCLPCISCYNQTDPIFSPKSSSTYNNLACESSFCSQLPRSGCTSKNLCEYQYAYGDKSFTIGVLSNDSFSFSSASDSVHNSDNTNLVSIPNIVFGCSQESNGTFNEHGGGLVGLGAGPLSLVSQISSSIDNKFSYCLVPYSDSNSTSLLNFGDRAVVKGGVSTPIVPGDPDTFYFLSLKSIYVEDEEIRIPTPENIGGGDHVEGNIIIDSGTTLTLLPSSMLDPLIEKVANKVKYPEVQDPNEIMGLCFDVSSAGDRVELPELTFEFSGNATVKLQDQNSYVNLESGVVCLGIVSSDNMGIAIYGNIAQQNFHIGYDMENKKLTIAPADCTKF